MSSSVCDSLDTLIAFVEKHAPKHRMRFRDGMLIKPFRYELDEPWKTAVRKAKKMSQRRWGK